MGAGLMPDTLEAFMTQRYRWVYGAMQIMKRHAGAIFLGRSRAVLGAALSVPVRLAALDFRRAGHGRDAAWRWSGPALMWVAPQLYRRADAGACRRRRWRCSPPRLIKTLLLYPPKVRSGVKGALMASVAGLSLTHTVGKAVWSGLFTSGKPFLRTPKCEDPALLQPGCCAWCGRKRRCSASACSAMISMGFDRRLSTIPPSSCGW